MLYLIILGIVTLVGFITLKDFKKGFILVVSLRLLIPASVRLIGISISLNTFLSIILLASFIIHKIYKNKMPSKLQFIISSFILSSLLLAPYALNMGIIDQLKKMLGFFIVDMLLGLLGWYAIQSENDFKKFFKAICITLFIIGIYGLYEYITKSNPYADWATTMFEHEQNFSSFFLTEKRGFLEGRIMGTSFHPLAWGLIMSTAFIFILNNKNLLHVNIRFILLLIIISNVFLCGSRSALIMIGVYFVIRLLEKPKKIFRISILTILIIACSISILPKTEKTEAFIKTIESSIFFWNEKKSIEAGIGGSSISMRMEQLIFSFYLIQDSFLTGNGYGFSDIAQQSTTKRYEKMMGFESIIFTKIVNQGILGLLFFLIFYFSFLFYACKQMTNKIEKYKIKGLYYAFLIGIIFTGLQNSFYLFFLLSMIQTKKFYLQKSNKNI